jgi:FAD/FMN-containing dehydrogenase
MKMERALNEVNENIVYDELKRSIGEDKIKNDDIVLSVYGSDTSVTPYRKPSFVILPEDKEDVRKVLEIANRYKIPVTVMSGGVSVTGLTIPAEGGILLDLHRMDRILEINADSGYALIEPGVTFDRFTAALARSGFRCQVSTAPGGSTPIGNYLMRPSGSLSTRHLDPILDLEVVLPDGSVVNTGSSQFPSAGSFLRYGPHPDFTGLFCCSFGTLGIVTKAAVRIYPINESNRVHLVGFDTYESSVKYVKDVVNNNIPEHCIIWCWTHYMAYEITVPPQGGMPNLPPGLKDNPGKPPVGVPYNIVTTFMSGYEQSMRANEKILSRVAEKYGGKVLSKKEARKLSPSMCSAWKEFYEEYHQPRMEGTKKYGMGRYMAWIVNAEPKDVVNIESFAVDKLYNVGARPICYYSMPFDFGRSMFFRLFTYVDPKDKELTDNVQRTFKEMYDTAMRKYNAVPFRYRGVTGNVWLEQSPEFYRFYKKIKDVLDPNNILNRNMNIF